MMSTVAILASLGASLTADGAATAAPAIKAVWERVTEQAAFGIRDTAEDLVYQDRLWLSNGYYNGNVLNRDLWTSTDGKEWTLHHDATPYTGYSEMVVFDGKMWAIKGDVWNSTDGKTWTQVAPSVPFGVRGYGEVVVHDGKLWHLGSGTDVWSSADGITWTCVNADAPFGKRYGSAVVVFGGKLWLMGGSCGFASDPPEKHYPAMTTFNDVWSSVDGVTWVRVLEHAPWAPRQWFVSKEYAGRMWIIGGFSNRESLNYADVWGSRDGRTWEAVEMPAEYLGRHEPTVYVWRDSLWIVAGNAWPLLNDVWRMTVE
ncbi:MAG: hypothetical protein HUU35_11530 [Armatimonadetes bacterium]|nr:hypothetical protein [Armatimonadota bacterium]